MGSYLFNIGRFGQLANRLFLCAHLLSFAKEYKFKFVNLVFEEYADYFNGTYKNLLSQYPENALPIQSRKLRNQVCKLSRYALSTLKRLSTVKNIEPDDFKQLINLESKTLLDDLTQASIIIANGWRLRADKALANHHDLIKNYFSLRDPYQSNVNKIVATARNDAEILIGAHIRRGDYRRFYPHYVYSIDKYKELLKATTELFPNKQVHFLLCFDEALNDKFSDFNITYGTGKAVEDLYALSRCDYIIGPPSTFSIWASFIANTPLYIIKDSAHTPNLADFKTRLYDSELEESLFFSEQN